MNKKQLFTVWLGVALIIFFVCCRTYLFLYRLSDAEVRSVVFSERLWLWLLATQNLPLIVAALAVGLTCTFADKKPKDEQKQ